ncbi:MAG: flagellar protein FlaG [Fidelibacterota bacterium]|nr:MAG: flagellar protein FlaG [Candidatus Neomarinimicrobiota bacterium]
MVETIKNVTAIVEHDPNRAQTDKVDRNRSPGKDKAPQKAPDFSRKTSEPEAVQGTGTELSVVVKDINTLVFQVATTKVSFDVDEETGRSVVRVVNKETGEVIRQVPPEELLTLVARMRQLSGLIFNKEV